MPILFRLRLSAALCAAGSLTCDAPVKTLGFREALNADRRDFLHKLQGVVYRTSIDSNPGVRSVDARVIAGASNPWSSVYMLNPYLLFWSIGLLFFVAEWLRPARKITYRAVFWRDLLALGAYNLSFLLVVQVTDQIPVPQYLPVALYNLPTAGKLLLFYIVEDFGLYWVHRLMHTRVVWPIHRWHHSPTSLYWLAGIRTTIPHIALFNVTYVAALPLLHDASGWAFQVIMVEHIVRNNWMHVNVTWKSSWLEWVFVTPRYHHIHHSSDPAHQVKNLGAVLTIWDRLFGTYYNPDDVTGELKFGLSERVNPVRLVIGV